MSEIFTVSNILYIISAIDDSLYMSDSPACVDMFYKDKEFIGLCFHLKNGKIKLHISEQYGQFYYLDDSDKELAWFQFRNNEITDTNGSFHKAFRQTREFDRQYSNPLKSVDTSIDRASFGLSEEN
jgi:hypothetical protein